MIVLNGDDVRKHLPMATAIELIDQVMVAVSDGKAHLPLRTAMDIDGVNKLGMMPGVLSEPPVYGVKLISLFPGNPSKGLSSHIGAMVLFDPDTGAPWAMVDADALTAIRTAAASAVATRALSRTDAQVLALVGTGEQAHTHLAAICAVRDIRQVRVAGRTPNRAADFIDSVAVQYPDIGFHAAADAQDALCGADIVCTLTSSTTPVIRRDWIAAGTHVNAVGASVPSIQEIDTELVIASRLFTDYRPSALAQARDIIAAIDSGAIDADHILGEIGEVLAGRVQGRRSDADITLYRSLGIAAQDLICARHAALQAQPGERK